MKVNFSLLLSLLERLSSKNGGPYFPHSLGGCCLVAELYWKGSATNWATQFSFKLGKECNKNIRKNGCPLKYRTYISLLKISIVQCPKVQNWVDLVFLKPCKKNRNSLREKNQTHTSENLFFNAIRNYTLQRAPGSHLSY